MTEQWHAMATVHTAIAAGGKTKWRIRTGLPGVSTMHGRGAQGLMGWRVGKVMIMHTTAAGIGGRCVRKEGRSRVFALTTVATMLQKEWGAGEDVFLRRSDCGQTEGEWQLRLHVQHLQKALQRACMSCQG